MKAHKDEKTIERPREGVILDWQLWDEHLEPVIGGLSRKEMRELHRKCGGIRVKVTVTH